jgi:hypothetical protein
MKSNMSIRFFLGAYWRDRRESIELCADRLHRMFSELSACDETLAIWYKRGGSRKQALEKRADVGSRDYLLSLLDRGRHRRDTDKTIIDDLGFGIGLWNGAANVEKEASLGITCGLYTANPNLGNCVAITLPEDLGKLRQSEQMARVLAVIAKAWEPDWAGVMSTDSMNAKGFNAKVPFVDWMLYISDRLLLQIPTVSPPATVQQIERLGSLFVAQSEAPGSQNPNHLRNIEQLQVALGTVC